MTTPGSPDTRRAVDMERTSLGFYTATNVRGGTLRVGSGEDADFTPVELLLAAIGGCTMIDVDNITSRRAEPTHLRVTVSGDKVKVDGAAQMTGLTVTWDVAYPEGPEGDQARAVLHDTIRMSHDRLCTVGRTVEVGSPIGDEMA
ncbi:OsmC family protein [Arsenicicoccus dermatophilus]|uniref:OsmC family protein n=1 Tax=Arsenicicoccus dermatophilus TaxID=1076331 RepID=UPI001F4C91E7|nr:OsmC family protein [Arsenicicoccus dermatophilus]MCH8612436.1 OsmC family protein [Arsenicicoccus dermatophilus]